MDGVVVWIYSPRRTQSFEAQDVLRREMLDVMDLSGDEMRWSSERGRGEERRGEDLVLQEVAKRRVYMI